MVSVVGGLLVSFVNSWQLTLVMTSFAPLMLLSGLFYYSALGTSASTTTGEDAAKVT